MSEPTPEYDPADEDFDEQVALEPGLPDEMVEQILHDEHVDVVGLNFELIAENSPIVMMAFAAIAATETIKAMGLRKIVRDREYDEETKGTIYRWVLFVASIGASQTLGFRGLVLDVTGAEISYLESIAWGGIIVGALGALIYSMKLVKMLKNWIYKKFDTTAEEMNAPTVRGMAPVDPSTLPKPENPDDGT